MKVLVTGANGLLGTNTIKELLEQGCEVVGLLRDKSKFLLPDHPNLELFEGNFLDPNSVEGAFLQSEIIIHIAAETKQSLLKYSDYQKVNVEGTSSLIQLAIKHKVKKFIYVSSANAFGHGAIDDLGSEKDKIKEPFSKSLYAQSKLAAQELVLSRSNEIEVVCVNPSFLLGPFDSKPGSGKIILMGYRKKFVFYPPGGKNFVHVADAARGVFAAIENGKNGEAYLLANENLSYKKFFQILSDLTNSKTILIQIPKHLLLLIGLFGNLLAFLCIRNSFVLNNMKILCVNNYYSNQKAKKSLSLTFTPIDLAVREAVVWFKERKMIP